jgi:dephospho-CoA kinase
MAAYAVLNLPKIRAVLEASPVVIDGLYSWEEYTYLREQLKSGLKTVAVWAPPELRYSRLISRQVRPLTMEQARARDYAEIENVNKGGPIAMADYTIKNDTTLAELKEQVLSVIRDLR